MCIHIERERYINHKSKTCSFHALINEKKAIEGKWQVTCVFRTIISGTSLKLNIYKLLVTNGLYTCIS